MALTTTYISVCSMPHSEHSSLPGGWCVLVKLVLVLTWWVLATG